jgi:hypothetical protein
LATALLTQRAQGHLRLFRDYVDVGGQMSNEVNGVEIVPEAKPSSTRKASKRSSTAVKLIQAAALASVLVPLGSVSVETTTCTLRFSGGFSGAGCSNGSSGRTRFNFAGAPFYFELRLDHRQHDVSVTVDDLAISQADFQARLPAFLPGYTCLQIDTGNQNCENFQVTVEPPGTNSWLNWNGMIHWNSPTGLDPGLVRMLHEKGDRSAGEPPETTTEDNTYDEDMCLVFGCVFNPDPSISSDDQDFEQLIAALAPSSAVPEPASVILLGTGVSAFLYGRRRKRNPHA